ncbi:GGDEF domain protein [Fulvivirga imtechensis AK7]|uniref:histidine kinase n=1 Tax=Fulvivirga imtechensis AK7 TaxID=1237149 RepID=L8JRT0_9BACT|nr:two-component regulator propeller domain-containing protein [Fulvivirga imtechensis]ELR71671.1 GGDEF domain protein [Fulvivirga imtechensis AK7]
MAYLCHQLTWAQSDDIRFERLSGKGLSQNTIVSITQDEKGYLWIGTQDGLNKFDGYQFTVYSSEVNNSNSLIHNYLNSVALYNKDHLVIGSAGGLDILNIEREEFRHFHTHNGEQLRFSAKGVNSLFVDENEILWLGSINGLYRIDSLKGEMHHFTHKGDDPESISNNNVTCITRASDGTLWVGTENGLNWLDRSGEVFHRYQNDSINQKLTDNYITAIYEDRRGRIWVGTVNGLNLYKPATNEFEHFFADKKNSSSLTDSRITVLFHDSKDHFWVGTRDGLNRLVEVDKGIEFFHYNHIENDPNTLSNGWISSIFEDRTNVLWVGTYFGGLNKYNLEGSKFKTTRHNQEDPNTISSKIVRGILKDAEGNVWVGANPGLSKIDRKTGKVTRFFHDPNNPNSLPDDQIRSLCFDNNGLLWIGTRNKGLCTFNPSTGVFTTIRHSPNNPYSYSGTDVRVIYKDRHGDLWLGSDGQGLFHYEMSTGNFYNYKPKNDNPNSISSLYVYYAIREDHDGNLWVGTWEGLNMLNRKTGEWKRYLHDQNNASSLADDYVKAVLIDRNNDVWIATAGKGLDKLVDRQKGIFEHYTIKDGLANNHTYGLLEDNDGNIWISTNNGLSKFDPAQKSFKNYEKKDGLQDNEFNSGAFYKAEDGELFFGGINGFNAFFPEEIEDNQLQPQVVITDIQLFNKSVGIRDTSAQLYLDRHISYTDTITLDYDQKVISFEFASLHYSNPGKNQYAYMMEGFNEDWINTSADKRFVTYTNLAPGRYTFKVKATNNDGIWAEEPAKLAIIVTPPFWLTSWFIILSAFLLVGLVLSIHSFKVRNIKRQKRILEKLVAERIEELDSKNKLLHEQNDEILASNEELEAIQDEIVAQNEELARQKQELEKSYEDIRTISEIGNEIASMLDFEKIIERVYEHVNNLMDATEFGIGIYNINEKTIHFALYIFESRRLQGFTAPVDVDRFTSWSIRNKKPVWIGNVQNEYHHYLKSLDEFENDSTLLESIICIPLIVEGRIMGVVSVQSPKPNAYSQYQFDMLNALSTYIAVGLDNSNAYKSLEDKIEERTRDLNNTYLELLAANKNFDEFTYRSAHDLRGPVARLLGLCHLGKLEVNDATGLKFIEYLEKVAFEMDRMLSRLLRTHQSKKSQVSKGFIDIKKALDDILQSIAKTDKIEDISFDIEINPEVRLESDQALFSILLENVLQNAVRYQAPEKNEKKIIVRAWRDQDENQTVISVADNGIGIPAEQQAKVFDMFFIGTEASKGSGLGLYEAKLIAEKLGGEIVVERSDGECTEFRIFMN